MRETFRQSRLAAPLRHHRGRLQQYMTFMAMGLHQLPKLFAFNTKRTARARRIKSACEPRRIAFAEAAPARTRIVALIHAAHQYRRSHNHRDAFSAIEGTQHRFDYITPPCMNFP